MFRLKIALDLEWPLRQRLVTFLCAESQDVSHCRWFPERQHQVWPELSSEILALVIAAGFPGRGGFGVGKRTSTRPTTSWEHLFRLWCFCHMLATSYMLVWPSDKCS